MEHYRSVDSIIESFQKFKRVLNMTRKNLTPFFLLVALMAFSLSCWAQFAQRGGISGFVFDPSGAAVVGAHVTLVDVARNQTRETVADASGHFEFNDLSAGEYQLSITQQGFETTKSESITVS